MVIRTVSATDAKNRFGAIVKSANNEGDIVLIENHGDVHAVLLSPAEYQRLQESDIELRRRVRLERLDELMRIQAERNSDLREEAAEALVQRALDEDRVLRNAAETDRAEVVIIEGQTEPATVLISFSEYQQLRKAREELAEKDLLSRFDRIMADQAERNRDLTPEEADEMAIRAVEESRARDRAQTAGR